MATGCANAQRKRENAQRDKCAHPPPLLFACKTLYSFFYHLPFACCHFSSPLHSPTRSADPTNCRTTFIHTAMNHLAESTRATINSLKAHRILSRALVNDPKPTPGYLFPEIASKCLLYSFLISRALTVFPLTTVFAIFLSLAT